MLVKSRCSGWSPQIFPLFWSCNGSRTEGIQHGPSVHAPHHPEGFFPASVPEDVASPELFDVLWKTNPVALSDIWFVVAASGLLLPNLELIYQTTHGLASQGHQCVQYITFKGLLTHHLTAIECRIHSCFRLPSILWKYCFFFSLQWKEKNKQSWIKGYMLISLH